jgi:hypothetical protein
MESVTFSTNNVCINDRGNVISKNIWNKITQYDSGRVCAPRNHNMFLGQVFNPILTKKRDKKYIRLLEC